MRTRTNSFLPLILISLAAACSDVAGPSAAVADKTHWPKGFPPPKVNASYTLQTDQTDVPTIPVVYVPQTAFDFCKNAIDAAGDIYADQTQTLTYAGSPTGNRYSDTVVAGAMSVVFRRWEGTFNGSPLKCVKLIKLIGYRAAWQPNQNTVANGVIWNWQSSDDATDSHPNWAVCYGTTACNQGVPWIEVTAQFTWHRECSVGAPSVLAPDNPDAYHIQYFWLGDKDFVDPLVGARPFLVRVRSDGSWTYLKWGGEDNDGYWGWKPYWLGGNFVSLYLCGLFYSQTGGSTGIKYPDAFSWEQHRPGYAVWRLPY